MTVAGEARRLAKQVRLFDLLNASGVRYCHWKSNCRLGEALSGKTDFDLLVDRGEAQRFESLIADLGFRKAVAPRWDEHPAIHHFYGLDEESGNVVHLHVYYRIVTGGGLLKNYHLPVESLLLDSTELVEGVRVPSRAAELVVFVLRKSIEQASLVEASFLSREATAVREEMAWLARDGVENDAMRFYAQAFREGRRDRFEACLSLLKTRGPSFAGYFRARRLRATLRHHRLRSPVVAASLVSYRLLRTLHQRFIVRRRGYSLGPGGFVVAFVGSDGAGKSTLVGEASRWMGENFDVRVVHTGKPPSTWLSFLPNILLPLLRKAMPGHQVNRMASMDGDAARRPSLVSMVRSVLIAHDQRAAILKAHQSAHRGALVICDRYPSALKGGIDGPRVDPSDFPPEDRWRRKLAEIEKRIYGTIPRPDHVFFLDVPLELALERNATRNKKEGAEDAESIRARYKLVQRWSIPETPITRIDTSQPVECSVLTIKRTMWGAL